MIRLSISHGRFAHSMRIIFILLAHVRSSYTLDRTRTYSTYIWQLLFQHSNMRKCEWESQIFLIFVKFRFCYQFFQIKRALALVQHDGISVNIWTSFVLNISRIFTNQIQIKFLLEVFKQIIKVCSLVVELILFGADVNHLIGVRPTDHTIANRKNWVCGTRRGTNASNLTVSRYLNRTDSTRLPL